MTGARYERNSSFVYRQIVDEFVLVPVLSDVADMDCIYTLNEVGASIWQQLETPATCTELQRALLDQYAVDADTLATDVEAFLSDMLTIGAVREV